MCIVQEWVFLHARLDFTKYWGGRGGQKKLHAALADRQPRSSRVGGWGNTPHPLRVDSGTQPASPSCRTFSPDGSGRAETHPPCVLPHPTQQPSPAPYTSTLAPPLRAYRPAFDSTSQRLDSSSWNAGAGRHTWGRVSGA